MIKREEMIESLINMQFDKNALNSMDNDELKELYDEFSDDSILFPNGRDYDAEDEDWA